MSLNLNELSLNLKTVRVTHPAEACSRVVLLMIKPLKFSTLISPFKIYLNPTTLSTF